MNNRGIYHLDIKLKNLVLTKTGHVYVIDFGCAKALANGKASTGTSGDVRYFSPERLACCRYYDMKEWNKEKQPDFDVAQADAWAVGATLLELIAGQYPFEDNTLLEKFAHWERAYFVETLKKNRFSTKSCQEFIGGRHKRAA